MVAESRRTWVEATVAATHDVADRIRRIELRLPPGGRRAPAGSHVDVEVDLGPDESGQRRTDVRSYSVVDSSDDGTEVAISVLLVRGTRGGSRFMHGLEAGATIRCTRPRQSFELRLGAARYVLVAGGVGITALAPMSRVLHATGRDYAMAYAGRDRAAMAYLDDLEAMHGERLRTHVDAEGSPLDVAALVAEIAEGEHARDTELYMCGPIRLMDAVRRAWADAGLPAHHLRFETFGSSGWFEAEPFEVRVPRLGLTATVAADSTILETLAEAGADVMFDCRKGECGLCQVDVVEVHGAVDHRDVFLSSAQQQADSRLCTCVSRAVRGPGREAETEEGRAVLVLDLP